MSFKLSIPIDTQFSPPIGHTYNCSGRRSPSTTTVVSVCVLLADPNPRKNCSHHLDAARPTLHENYCHRSRVAQQPGLHGKCRCRTRAARGPCYGTTAVATRDLLPRSRASLIQGALNIVAAQGHNLPSTTENEKCGEVRKISSSDLKYRRHCVVSHLCLLL